MPPTQVRPDPYPRARRQAEEAFADHEMTVLHEDGLYRHLRFARPNSWMYGFDLVTWPGHLVIDGDIGGGFVFARIADMIDFFAADGDINPGYWSEKITSRGARDGTRVYQRSNLDERVAEALTSAADTAKDLFALQAAWREHVRYVDLEFEHPAREALRDFEHNGRQVFDAWEWDLKDWDHHFLLACFAIKHGVAMYRTQGSGTSLGPDEAAAGQAA
jgi:hypothetical protein